MPSADFSDAIGPLCDEPSPPRRTRRRPPEVSSTAFAAPLPNLHPPPLMDMDFAVKRPLVRRRMPLSGFCSSGRDCRSPLPSDPASRRRPCGSLALHLHPVVRGTCTPRLPNMLGTRYGPSPHPGLVHPWIPFSGVRTPSKKPKSGFVLAHFLSSTFVLFSRRQMPVFSRISSSLSSFCDPWLSPRSSKFTNSSRFSDKRGQESARLELSGGHGPPYSWPGKGGNSPV